MSLNDTISALGTSIINLVDRKTPIATANTVGMVKPDGNTININADGVISSNGGGSSLEVCDIGIALYVDETKGLRRYLNGQIVDINTNTQAFLNRLKQITTLHPSLLCPEEEWQTAKTMSAFGQVGKFVFNYSGNEVVSVRLPRVVNVQGLFDLQNLGMTVGAGLPNIEGVNGKNYWDAAYYSGAFYKGSVGHGLSDPAWGDTNLVSFDASRSNPIYGKSDTVQPEAIQYPYFIQIATGSETENNIVNTLENVNGFTLLESKYSDKPLYNESWLLSNGQYNAKAVYPTVYEGLQVEYNTGIEVGTTVTLPSGVSYTKRGLSVKLSTEEYTDYDFVLNTSDETFRLPLLDGDRVLVEKKVMTPNDKTWYNLYSDGWCEQGGYVTSASVTLLKPYINTSFHVMVADGTNLGSTSCTNVTITDKSTLSINSSWCEGAWWEAKGYTNISTNTGVNLYFYVGDIDQNHGIVNMGRIGEQLADCITRTDCKAYITETYQNGSSWYRVYSDGWCEQGGIVSAVTGGTKVTFLKPFKDTNYTVLSSQPFRGYTNDAYNGGNEIGSITATSCIFYAGDSGTHPQRWIAQGYIA